MAETDHLADVNTGPGSGWLENTKKKKKKKMFALFSLVSLQPKQLFILSKLSLSGAYLFSLLPDLKIYHHFIFVFCLNIQSIFTSFTSFDPHKPVDRED